MSNTQQDGSVGFAPEPAPPPIGGRQSWMARYRRRLVFLDLLAATLAVGLAFLIRFGQQEVYHGGGKNATVCVLIPLVWIALVAINRAYDERFVGVGPQEFSRIFRAFLVMTALISFASYSSHVNVSRGLVLAALPLCLLFTFIDRYAARKWLHSLRRRDRALTSVLAVGDAQAIVDFTLVARRDRYAGMQVVGACVPSDLVVDPETHRALDEVGVRVMGDVDSVLAAVATSHADTVAVVSSGLIGPQKLRYIGWQLEGSATSLVVSPGLMEIAGPRLHIHPMAGLPLLHVEEPELAGFRRALKGVFDRSLAGLMIALSWPAWVAVAVAIRLTSAGPVFFRQTRVGRHGDTFTMLKFRSLYLDGTGVTRVGSVLRRFSIDDIPALLNVITGSMSLVGPRPLLPREVAGYDPHVYRRLLVKPGISGLDHSRDSGHPNGPGDVLWDEALRRDLRYVENWSMANDLMIMWKTLFALFRSARSS